MYKIQLKSFNRILKNVIKNAKKMFYENEFDINKSDIRKTWNTIKNAMNKIPSKNTLPKCLVSKDLSQITSHTQIADEFNHYFVNIGQELSQKLSDTNNDNNNSSKTDNSFEDYLLINSNHIKFNFKNVTEREIKNIILQLESKNSSGIDGISSKLIKTYHQIFSKPMFSNCYKNTYDK